MAFEFGWAGIGSDQQPITYQSSLVRGTDEGKTVNFASNGTVQVAPVDTDFVGIAKTIAKHDAACVVQTKGIPQKELAYSGETDPTLGFNALQADGIGGVKVGGTIKYMIMSVDTVNKKVWISLG